jgi:PadR family transcriptional regulator, regulatory protein PadR
LDRLISLSKVPVSVQKGVRFRTVEKTLPGSKRLISCNQSTFSGWQRICSAKVELMASMRRTYLGEFEEVVLLTVAVLFDQAYGVLVTEEIERQTGREVSISAVHAALSRLEEKGFVNSRMGGATQERGGRRKRFFTATVAGTRALREIHETRNQLWGLIPKAALE